MFKHLKWFIPKIQTYGNKFEVFGITFHKETIAKSVGPNHFLNLKIQIIYTGSDCLSGLLGISFGL